MDLPTRRIAACVAAWPECWTGGYDPRCCRFPKSCSCTVYDEQHVQEGDLEPMSPELPPRHDGPHVRSIDGDGKPLGYCAICYEDMEASDD